MSQSVCQSFSLHHFLQHPEQINMDLKVKKIYGSKTGMWSKVKLSSWRDTNQWTRRTSTPGWWPPKPNTKRQSHWAHSWGRERQVSASAWVSCEPCSVVHPHRSQWPEVQCSFDPYLWEAGTLQKDVQLLTFLSIWGTLLIAPEKK